LDIKEVEKKVKEWCMDEGIFKIKRPSDEKTEFIIDITYYFTRKNNDQGLLKNVKHRV